MDPEHDSKLPQLRDYLAVLRARKWTIALVLLVVAGAGIGLSLRQTPMYSATARLLVKGIPTDASGYVPPPAMETEAEIVASEPVAERVIEDLDLATTSQQLLDVLQVELVSERAAVLSLSYSSTSPEMAHDIPLAFAEQYIQYKTEQAQEALDEGRASIEAQIEAVQTRLSSTTQELAESEQENETFVQTLEAERDTLIARLGVLQQRLDDFEARQPVDLSAGQVIQPPVIPTSPSSPNHLQNGLAAATLGLLVGIGLAFLRERLDDRIRGQDDLERAIDAPVLATVPRYATRSKAGRDIVTISQPRGSASESYRTLRTNIQFLSVQKELQSLLVTSPAAGEGKTATAVNLAVAFAQAGRRVVLVSADLRRPTLEEYFGISNAAGLTTWLMAEDQELWGLICDPGVDNLRVIPAGPIPPNPAELLASRRLSEMIGILETNSDLVLVDSPPALVVADAAILGPRVDGMLLVLDAQRTTRSAAARAAQELGRAGASLAGAVYNGFDPSGSPYYQTYYSADYGERESESGRPRRRRSASSRR